MLLLHPNSDMLFSIKCERVSIMSGYTVSMSIDLIDEFCENPSQYKPWQLREAINDARTHYKNGNASKDWYDSVVRILSNYV